MSRKAQDQRFMALALSLGRRAAGTTWPNPAVGCVIVQNGRIVGRGWTQPGGRPHAEVVALEQAGEDAKGATAYVSLEPCCHQGESPPCADALIAAGVARVVSALVDPDPRVADGGHARLMAAGVEVTTGVFAGRAYRDHQGFLLNRNEGRPMITLKLATSFDGRIATAAGDSQWISDVPARRMVQALRANHDAVLVGGGTVRADNPRLSVRDFGDVTQPLRIVCSRLLDLPLDATLARTAKTQPVMILHGADAPPDRATAWRLRGAKLQAVAVDSDQQLDLVDAAQALGRHGLTRVLCEGGGALAASLLQAGLVDELVVFTAGLAIGAEGTPALGALGLDKLADAPRFRLIATQQVGADVMHRWARILPQGGGDAAP